MRITRSLLVCTVCTITEAPRVRSLSLSSVMSAIRRRPCCQCPRLPRRSSPPFPAPPAPPCGWQAGCRGPRKKEGRSTGFAYRLRTLDNQKDHAYLRRVAHTTQHPARRQLRYAREARGCPERGVPLTLCGSGVQLTGMSDERREEGFSLESLGEDPKEDARSQLALLEESLESCREPSEVSAVIDEAYRAAHALKAAVDPQEMPNVDRLARRMQDIVRAARSGSLAVTLELGSVLSSIARVARMRWTEAPARSRCPYRRPPRRWRKSWSTPSAWSAPPGAHPARVRMGQGGGGPSRQRRRAARTAPGSVLRLQPRGRRVRRGGGQVPGRSRCSSQRRRDSAGGDPPRDGSRRAG